MQSSTTESWFYSGFVYGPISSNPARSFLSITRRNRSIHTSSKMSSANSVLSNSFDKLKLSMSPLSATELSNCVCRSLVLFEVCTSLTSGPRSSSSAVRSTSMIDFVGEPLGLLVTICVIASSSLMFPGIC